MKTLHLNLQKKWFDLILSGEKKEEYREIKESMISKFINWQKTGCTRGYFEATINMYGLDQFNDFIKQFDTVTFSNGMTHPIPRFEIELKSIEVGTGLEKWGAIKDKKYFILKLGRILDSQNT